MNDATCTRHVTRTTTIEDAIHHGRQYELANLGEHDNNLVVNAKDTTCLQGQNLLIHKVFVIPK